MSYRIIILEENDPKDSDRYAISGCQVITAPSPGMVERAVSALRAIRSRNGWTLTEAARAALTAALFEEEE